MHRPVRVLLLPSVPYEPLWRLHARGEHPRPAVTQELARDHAIVIDSIDPGTGWKNPFGRRHPFLRAFDPLRTLRVLLVQRRYDLIVSGNDGAAAALVQARRLVPFRTPVVIWDLSPATVWAIRIAAQDRTIPRLDGILSLNEVQRPYVAARWGAHVPVTVVGHWVDTDFYRPDPSAEAEAIVAVGDDPGRDYPALLRALDGLDLRTVIRTGLPLDLDPAGHRTVEPLRQRLDALAFRALYASARFVVVPLRADNKNAGGVSTILEAAAMGKAAIVSDSDGIREFVRHGETGLVVPAADPAALRAAIQRLSDDPATAARLGQNARRHVEQTASPAVFAGRLAAAFRTHARNRHPREIVEPAARA